jgi:CoA:oxalate CoA-transferase
VATYSYSGADAKRVGRHRQDLYPSTIMPCRDGFILLSAVTQREWTDLLGLIGRSDLVDDPRFATAATRVAHREDIDALFAPWVAERDAVEIAQTAQARRVPLATISNPNHVLESPHLAARGYFREVVQADGFGLTMPGLPFRRRGSPQPPLTAAPRLGEHTGGVLRDWLGTPVGVGA